jgi:hypothetical protein
MQELQGTISEFARKYRDEPQNDKKILLSRALNGVPTELKYAETQPQQPSQSKSELYQYEFWPLNPPGG